MADPAAGETRQVGPGRPQAKTINAFSEVDRELLSSCEEPRKPDQITSHVNHW